MNITNLNQFFYKRYIIIVMNKNIEKKVNCKANQILEKINMNENTYLIFGLESCGYCKKTLTYLRSNNLQFKYYEMDEYYTIFIPILDKLIELEAELKIDPEHRTFPVIFYNKKFIGGYNELIKL
jgi:glutaredoxin